MIDRLLKCGVVWLALVWSLFGLEASNTPKRYFQCYDIKNGLTQNTVLSILQDHNGFMWFGTKDGLNRFDGKEFKSFIYGENDEYECRFVSTLCEASDGLIWVGTDWGVCYYDERTEEIYPFTTKSTDGATIANPVSLICEPRPGELWIVVERQGIFRYDLKTKQLHNVSVKDKRHQQVVFTSMAFDDKGRVWLGTFGQGLVYTDDGFKTIHEYRDAAGQEPLASQVVTKIALHSGVLYVSTEYTGLHIIDVVTNQMSTLFQHDETGAVPYIRDFLFYGDTEVWLATESGLYIYDMVTRSSSHYRHSLNDAFSISDNALYVLYRDREGGVWIGSYFGGVNYLQSNRPYFEKFYPGTSGLHGQQVREFCGDRDGNIWIGTEDGGLNKYDPRTKRFQYIDESRRFSNIHGLCAVGDHLWVGTFSQGIRLIDTRSNRVLRSYVKGDASGLNSNNVFSIYQTRSGELYIGTMYTSCSSHVGGELDGVRKLMTMGNAYLNKAITLNNIPDGSYEWGVQTINASYEGSTFAVGSLVVGSGSGVESMMSDDAVKVVAVAGGVELQADGNAVCQIYLVSGQLVNEVSFTDFARVELPSGCYLVKVTAAHGVKVQKVVL